MGLSDTAMGMLTGFAFAMFYATLGIPIARYADRSNRRNLIASLWEFGVSSPPCQASHRISGICWPRASASGSGEAGCSPPAHSMIADYYPAEQRATALGIYSLGIPIGIMFGLFAGGWINEFFGWRMAFFVVGVPGIILALVVRFTLAEPPRGLPKDAPIAARSPASVKHWPIYGRKNLFAICPLPPR